MHTTCRECRDAVPACTLLRCAAVDSSLAGVSPSPKRREGRFSPRQRIPRIQASFWLRLHWLAPPQCEAVDSSLASALHTSCFSSIEPVREKPPFGGHVDPWLAPLRREAVDSSLARAFSFFFFRAMQTRAVSVSVQLAVQSETRSSVQSSSLRRFWYRPAYIFAMHTSTHTHKKK